MSLMPTQTNQIQRHVTAKVFLWGFWMLYLGYVLLSELPPGESLLHTTPATLKEALDLSLNYWFVLPLLAPQVAPVLNPALEGLFNLVLAWGLLMVGFGVDGRGQRWPMLPFLLGTAFLTNVFFLPWVALRSPNPTPPPPPLSRLERLSESRGLPLLLLAVAIASLLWATFGRPEFGDLGDRWASLVAIVQGDRLSYSIYIDMLVFWLFQGALVPDDMARRQWHNPAALWLARLLPFMGLVWYLLWRPSLPQSAGKPPAGESAGESCSQAIQP
ncbi:MAG: hypothetical protein KME20_00515 [Kaiparowitsia implicata GSE-PSE-MK54-09C]|nr:hypothetical protein [Kaiparowitsia implicata GSE-PSE-MK54-09C]